MYFPWRADPRIRSEPLEKRERDLVEAISGSSADLVVDPKVKSLVLSLTSHCPVQATPAPGQGGAWWDPPALRTDSPRRELRPYQEGGFWPVLQIPSSSSCMD